MKKTSKILSVFLALLMVFTCVPMTAFAADRDTSSLSAYLKNDNLAEVAGTLLTDLGDRKEELVPTILNLVFQLVPDLKKQAEADGVNVMDTTTEKLADELIAYLDKVLADANLNDMIADYKGIIGTVLGGVDVDLNSVDGIIGTLVGVLDFVDKSNEKTWGDLYLLDSSALKNGKSAISTKNSSGLAVVYALFDALSDPDNVAVVKKVVKGEFSLGTINGTLKSLAKLDIESLLNDTMKNLDGMINELIYNYLIADKVEVEQEDGTTKEVIETAFADSSYKDFNADELLAAALVKAIDGGDVTLARAQEVAKMTLYELVGEYADKILGSETVLNFLNVTLKDALKELIAKDEQLKVLEDVVNLNYEFKADTFNFKQMAQEGLFENLNNFVCEIIEVIVQPDVYKELNLKTGGNENITDNLTSFFGFVLKTLASNNGGKLEFTIDEKAYSYDFSGFTADKLADKSLEDMVVAVLKLFYVDWFGAPAPDDADTLEKLAVYTAYTAIDKFMVKNDDVDGFTTDYKDLVYNADGSVKDITVDGAVEAIGEMGMDVALYWLNKYTNIGVSQEDIAKFKADGWTWEDFLEEIVDWALGYIDGIPAVNSKPIISKERGVKDGYGAWYKLNVILNEMIPLSFVNGCGDATFTVDTYALIIEKAVPAIADCKFDDFADILSMNDKADNPFNQPLISSAVDFIDSLIFSLVEHTCGTPADFTKEATATRVGYKGTYDPNNGHYVTAEEIPAKGEPTPVDPTPVDPTPVDPTPVDPTPVDPTPVDPTPVDPTPVDPTPVDPTPEVMRGDVNQDGKITAADARVALRIAANLEPYATAEMLAAADVKGTDNKVTAADARMILRYAAKLETTL